MSPDCLHHNTPLLESRKISIAGSRVWLKIEAMQPAGSFKNRGVGAACQHYASQGARHFVSSSGGNAGIATAYAGQQLNIPVNVVVPRNAPETAIAAMQEFGAGVEVNGDTWQEAHQRALSLVGDDSVVIHPFDDPILWPGHATLIDEVIDSGVRPDAVVLSVGGGGLLCGIALGLTNHGLSDCPIIAVETEGAASLHGAIRNDAPFMLDRIETIANTLGAKQVCEQARAVTRSHDVHSYLVSDKQALDACLRFRDQHRVLVEPACGAALSAVYEPPEVLNSIGNILVVVCGGMGVSDQQFKTWQAAVS
ncbi:MAG: pyridoxal-phosphate dependent enzyme [Pseudomonadota bacterium]